MDGYDVCHQFPDYRPTSVPRSESYVLTLRLIVASSLMIIFTILSEVKEKLKVVRTTKYKNPFRILRDAFCINARFNDNLKVLILSTTVAPKPYLLKCKSCDRSYLGGRFGCPCNSKSKPSGANSTLNTNL